MSSQAGDESEYHATCPATPDGRMPWEELSDCEFCKGMHCCVDYTVPVPLELEPLRSEENNDE